MSSGQEEYVSELSADGIMPLRDPVMLAAFEGWNDAGEAASGALTHLLSMWETTQFTELDSELYHDFQVNRPTVNITEDGKREIVWPATRIHIARPADGGRDVVIVQGIEPSMRWRSYVSELLGIADELGVTRLVTVAALLADVPHTRPIPVTRTSEDADLRRELNAETSNYEGPTGIVGVLQDAANAVGVPSVSLWAMVPHYVGQPPSPKATLALLREIEDVLDVPIPQGELPEDSRAWEHGVNELAEEDTEIGAYVRQLEEAKDTAELPEATGEAIAREFEKYLRRRGDEPPRA